VILIMFSTIYIIVFVPTLIASIDKNVIGLDSFKSLAAATILSTPHKIDKNRYEYVEKDVGFISRKPPVFKIVKAMTIMKKAKWIPQNFSDRKGRLRSRLNSIFIL